jgi:hypothetical protein
MDPRHRENLALGLQMAGALFALAFIVQAFVPALPGLLTHWPFWLSVAAFAAGSWLRHRW